LFDKLADWLDTFALPCFYRTFLGIDCPGCGMQRAFTELLRGNLMESLSLYPALIPSIILILILAVHLIFKLQHGAMLLKIIFIINALILVFHYIYKILIH
jgi:hypothetical protein